MYNYLAKNIFAPTLDLLRGTKTMKCLKELQESQWWSRDKILELQNQKLRQLIKYAYDNVPYYRRMFDETALKPEDIENSQDLAKLPVLTKQLIRKNFNEIAATNFPKKQRVQLATGGSTGEPLVFYSTKNEHFTLGFAASQRACSWIGFEIGDKFASLRIRYPSKSMTEKFWRMPVGFFRRKLLFDVQYVSRNTMPLAVRKLEAFQPNFLESYPSALYQLALFIQKEGKTKLSPKAVVTGGEQLYDYQRDLFRNVFGCDTYSHYGSNEVHHIASECPAHSGYHITAEYIIIEIANEKGEPVPVGKEGRILITNLQNYAMPFIRYDIGDKGIMSDEICPCGRGLPLLKSLSGRTDDMILTKSRGPIPGMYIPHRQFALPGIEQFQVVQETYEKVVIRLVIDYRWSKKQTEELNTEIIRQLKPILGEDMDITVQLVDHIPLSRTGKAQSVISRLHQENQAIS